MQRPAHQTTAKWAIDHGQAKRKFLGPRELTAIGASNTPPQRGELFSNAFHSLFVPVLFYLTATHGWSQQSCEKACTI